MDLRPNTKWLPSEFRPQAGVPLADAQQVGELGEAVQLRSGDPRRQPVSRQQVGPDVLLLHAGQEVLEAEHRAEPHPLLPGLLHLLPPGRSLVGLEELQHPERERAERESRRLETGGPHS